MAIPLEKFDAVMAALERLYLPVEAKDFCQHAVDVLTQFFTNSVTVGNIIDTETGAVLTALPSWVPNPQDVIARIGQHIGDNPIAQFLMKGGSADILDLDNFISRAEFHETQLYRQVFREFSTDSQVTFPLQGPSMVGGISLHKMELGAIVSEEDRQVGLALRPHIVRAFANACLLSALKARIAESERRASTIDAAEMSSAGLTSREIEVLHWLAEGKANAEIATILETSVRTIDAHVSRILEKLMVENRTAAVGEARRRSAVRSFDLVRPGNS